MLNQLANKYNGTVKTDGSQWTISFKMNHIHATVWLHRTSSSAPRFYQSNLDNYTHLEVSFHKGLKRANLSEIVDLGELANEFTDFEYHRCSFLEVEKFEKILSLINTI